MDADSADQDSESGEDDDDMVSELMFLLLEL